jgi:hypothetical protein
MRGGGGGGGATLFLPSAKLLAAPLLPRPEKRKLSSALPFRVPTRAHLQPAGDQAGNRTLRDRQNQTNQPTNTPAATVVGYVNSIM